MAEVTIRSDSRFKDTEVLSSLKLDATFFAMWKRPLEINEMIENATQYEVRNVDIGRIDILADQFYDNPRLWWIVASVNEIIDPIEDMFQGQVLFIPSIEDVLAYVSRRSEVVEEV